MGRRETLLKGIEQLHSRIGDQDPNAEPVDLSAIFTDFSISGKRRYAHALLDHAEAFARSPHLPEGEKNLNRALGVALSVGILTTSEADRACSGKLSPHSAFISGHLTDMYASGREPLLGQPIGALPATQPGSSMEVVTGFVAGDATQASDGDMPGLA